MSLPHSLRKKASDRLPPTALGFSYKSATLRPSSSHRLTATVKRHSVLAMNSRAGSSYIDTLTSQPLPRQIKKVSVPVVPDIINMGAVQSQQMSSSSGYQSRQQCRSIASPTGLSDERGLSAPSVRPNALLLPSTSANSSSFGPSIGFFILRYFQVSVPVVPDIINMGAVQSQQMSSSSGYQSRQQCRSIASPTGLSDERGNYYGGLSAPSVRPNALLLPSTSANSSSFGPSIVVQSTSAERNGKENNELECLNRHSFCSSTTWEGPKDLKDSLLA
ncbi:hypothetical protein Tcan_17665 [Toxocara canis]|uniref:Uncharacterized protein n=1 Tax=Toxocara canis TaxID=6265 RepID=A0A0B2UPB0_TOXCA|nr:hypothetical protein Tcan_17665 [Toxocara canis]